MARFNPAWNKTIDIEGGYQSNPNDRGNYNSLNQLVGTNWGVSAPLLELSIGRPPTTEDMKALTKEQAKSIYKANFWDKNKLGEINNQFTANHIFDLFVNHGGRNAADIVQDSVIRLGQSVTNDKLWGPQTRGAVNSLGAQGKSALLNNEIVGRRIQFYNGIVYNNPSQEVFLQGWLNRAVKFLAGRAALMALLATVAITVGFFLAI